MTTTIHQSIYHDLTSRETEVANLLLEGKTNLDICGSLGLQPSTVSTHKNTIFDKLGVGSVIGLKGLAEQPRHVLAMEFPKPMVVIELAEYEELVRLRDVHLMDEGNNTQCADSQIETIP